MFKANEPKRTALFVVSIGIHLLGNFLYGKKATHPHPHINKPKI